MTLIYNETELSGSGFVSLGEGYYDVAPSTNVPEGAVIVGTGPTRYDSLAPEVREWMCLDGVQPHKWFGEA